MGLEATRDGLLLFLCSTSRVSYHRRLARWGASCLRCVFQVKIVAVEKKVNEIVNRLEKTKVESLPDLAAEKEARDQEERNEKKTLLQDQKKQEKEEQKRKKELDELK